LRRPQRAEGQENGNRDEMAVHDSSRSCVFIQDAGGGPTVNDVADSWPMPLIESSRPKCHTRAFSLEVVEQSHHVVCGELDQHICHFRVQLVAQPGFEMLHRRYETLIL